jgi:hypothetical protein
LSKVDCSQLATRCQPCFSGQLEREPPANSLLSSVKEGELEGPFSGLLRLR